MKKFKGRPLWLQQSKRFGKFWHYNFHLDWVDRAYEEIELFSEQFHRYINPLQ